MTERENKDHDNELTKKWKDSDVQDVVEKRADGRVVDGRIRLLKRREGKMMMSELLPFLINLGQNYQNRKMSSSYSN